jgi:hypothetical protein
MRYGTDGTLLMYRMHGPAVLAADVIGAVGADRSLGGVGAFNADGMSDILFRRTDGMFGMYEMNGFEVLGAQFLGVGGEWSGRHGDRF